jgi:diguanylate cyclase (GGDEF)-like protein/PAS domain S-box-containing protein
VLDAARPVAVGLALLHVVLSLGHIAQLDPGIRGIVTAVTIGAASILVGIAIVLGRWRPPTNAAHPLAAVMAVCVLVPTAVLLVLTRKPEYTTNLSLLAIGTGLYFLSTAWLVAVLAGLLGTWLAIAALAHWSSVWLFFLFNVIGSIAIAIGAHLVRLGTLLRAERARLDAEERSRALGASEERYALSVEGANDGVYDWNVQTGEAYYSPRFKTILGFDDHELPNDPTAIERRIHPDDADRVRKHIINHLKGLTPHFEDEYRIMHRDGSYRWVLTRGVSVREPAGRAVRMAGSMTDMTGRGVFDPLTGLPNRMLLLDRLRRVFARGSRHATRFAVLFLDLDRFKIINDSLGHHTGDELLIQVARRLQAAVRASDTVARLGGDEFVIILEDVQDRDLDASIHRVEDQVSGGYRVGDRDIFITASIGAVIDTETYECAEDILRDADTAMYQAKQSDRSHIVFDIQMREAVRRRLQIEGELRSALEQEQFRLVYQPILSLKTGDLQVVEALARWDHPERGRVEPAEFISVMEEIGLILPFSSWALLEACLRLIAWDAVGADGRLPAVSVNLSGRQLARRQLSAEVARVLEKTGLEPKRLVCEITEAAIMDRGDEALATLADLKSLGVGLMMDDFGTGHSSLGALHSMPIDSLKIDHSFIRRLPADTQAIELVRTMIVLAHNLGLRVVAEGIESLEQLALLRGLDCDLGQGLLFGIPGDLGRITRGRVMPIATLASGA